MPGLNVRQLLAPTTDPKILSICEDLLKVAGYDPNNLTAPIGGSYNEEFLSILRTLAYIGARKTDQYGDFRMQDIRSKERELWGAYWDIQRKFGRLDTQLTTNAPPIEVGETCGDLAVYAVRLIQILERLKEKGWL